MKLRSRTLLLAVLVGLLMCSTYAYSSPSASLLFNETDLGGGMWQYDYTVSNTSDNGEYLYMFLLDFDQPVTTNGSALPTAWWGAVWEGDNTTSFMSAMSTKPATYITAGNSLGGFSFTVDQQVGEVPFHAEFIGTDSFDGTTVVPEPLSMILFAAGGGTMALRYRMRRKK